MKVLPESWETEHLHIRDCALSEVKRLQEVFNACAYVGRWDKTFHVETEETFINLISTSLSGGDNLDKPFKMQSIRMKGNTEIIGYFHMYYRSPRPDIVWMSMFVIHPNCQKFHFGSEVVARLSEQIKQIDEYTAIWLEVYLKNWPALRFWIMMGFTSIIEYRGDKIPADDSFASLVLEKRL